MISLFQLLKIMRDVRTFLTTTFYVLQLENDEKKDGTLRTPYSCLQQDDEELCLIWLGNPHVKLDIGFQGNGFYSYWGKDLRTQEEFIGDDVPISQILPQKLLDLLLEKTETF